MMSKNTLSIFFLLLLLFTLAGCSNQSPAYVPVIDISTIEQLPRNGLYTVAPGDTLYSIAWRYGLDYRYLAARNHIYSPYHITVGQKLYLNGKLNGKTVTVKNTFTSPPISSWNWPAQGQIIGQFSTLNKGINIAGRMGDPLYAAAAGQVVYSGDGLRGYGNLIIIKHNNLYLTAYAHNKLNLVKEGQVVKKGQIIGQMGNTESRSVMLHFEIRRGGQPVNPLSYLK